MKRALSPGLVVASPRLSAPPFDRSVVLVAEASEQGAMGFVLNQPMGLSLGEVARQLNLEIRDELRPLPVWAGGPVRPEQGWIVVERAEGDDEPVGTMLRLRDRFVVVASQEVLQDLMRDERASFRLFLGYSGWGQGQLESEIRDGAWVPLDYDEARVLDGDWESMWHSLLQDAGLGTGTFWGRGGGRA